MTIAPTSWVAACALLGFATGLRSMTPMAVLCWYACAGRLDLAQGWAAWTAHRGVALAWTLLALGELVADKTPWIPARIAPFPLAGRALLAALAGAIASTFATGAPLPGILLAVFAALASAFAGYVLRRNLKLRFALSDWKIALCEDLVTLLAAVSAMRLLAA